MASSSQELLRIGTRGSPLALVQAEETRQRLLAADPALAPAAIELVVIKTSGDRIQDRTLTEAGGKGLFTKELEEALVDRRIDLAVHSMKDMPSQTPSGLVIGAILPREDVRDALIARSGRSISDLPPRAHVGTASLRRQAQLLHRRPDLRVSTLRGNVETRLRKIDDGYFDATLLAMAGLNRLGLASRATAPIGTDEFLPAVAQGAIGIQCRSDDLRVLRLLFALDDEPTSICVAAERAMLARLDGSCRTPIAGLAELGADGTLRLRAQILRPDGSEVHEAVRAGAGADATRLGDEAGEELRRRGGPDFFSTT